MLDRRKQFGVVGGKAGQQLSVIAQFKVRLAVLINDITKDCLPALTGR
jgi:hypothetical protein